MRFFVLFSVICLSVSKELDSYKDFKVFAAKNHYKTVSDYAKSVGVTQLDTQWEQFKVKFERKYGPEEEEERKFNFLKTIQFIESHNSLFRSGVVSHEVDINQFADWSSEEYESILSAEPVPLNELGNITKHPEPSYYASVPPAFDWRQKGKVTPVKNQGSCGSCWAFAAIATIESAYAIRHNQGVSLSEQQLVDCDTANNGCNWGNVGKALSYVQQQGLESESAYPYHTRKQNCGNNGGVAHTRISGYRMLTHPATDQAIMEAIMNNGPVAVNIDCSGNDFAYYRGGIITTGNKNMNHYVTAVGWGPGYWIVKNSWGTSWGESGFGRIARGSNVRGFNQWLFYPLSSDEYNSILSAEIPALNEHANTTEPDHEPSYYAGLPPAFDWRSSGKVTPVKNQGQCGACWAFACIATIESAYAIKHNQAVSLSEQQLVDCDRGSNGCASGQLGKAYDYVAWQGLESEAVYPYHTRTENCANNGGQPHIKISGHRQLRYMASDEEIMDAIINNGPVSTMICASGGDFGGYRGGIITGGDRNVNHSVTLVGWGPGYWIIKNSWGTWWGEGGFARIAQGSNVRGINGWLFYPIV